MKIKFFPVGTLFAFVLFIPLVYANKVVINKSLNLEQTLSYLITMYNLTFFTTLLTAVLHEGEDTLALFVLRS